MINKLKIKSLWFLPLYAVSFVAIYKISAVQMQEGTALHTLLVTVLSAVVSVAAWFSIKAVSEKMS